MKTFHFVIIAYIFIFSGCGYKADPFYTPTPSEVQDSAESGVK